jgi:hypothetical protein
MTILLYIKVDQKKSSVIFQILMAASLKMTAFWDIAPCSLAEVDRRFRGAYCLRYQAIRPIRRNTPEGCHLHVVQLLRINM